MIYFFLTLFFGFVFYSISTKDSNSNPLLILFFTCLIVGSAFFVYLKLLSNNNLALVEQRDSLNLFIKEDVLNRERHRGDVEILTDELIQKETVEAGELYIIARQFKVINEYELSAKVFGAIYSKFGAELDGDILAEYAQVLFLSKGRDFDESLNKLLDDALTKSPNNPSALTLKGLSILEKNQPELTIKLWEKALQFLSTEQEKDNLKSLIETVKNQKN